MSKQDPKRPDPRRFYRRARFQISAARLAQSPPDEGMEVAFAGRSNAGKSSSLNTLCDQKTLARTSKTPGRTQLLNFFRLDEDRRLVDLPGYGFAKVSEHIKRQWQGELAKYLEQRQCLRGVMLLMDVRHPLKEPDQQMLTWAADIGHPVHVLLTKSDKLRKGAAKTALLEVRKHLHALGPAFSVQLFSAHKKTGLEDAYAVLDTWLERS